MSLLPFSSPGGTNGVQGPPGMVWQGTYNNATTYGTNDAVYYSGSSFIATAGTTGVNPGTFGAPNSPWQTLAAGNISAGGDMLAATYDPAGIASQLMGLSGTQTITGTKTFSNSQTTFVGNAVVEDSLTPTKAYRFRTSGVALDFEGGGTDLYLSVWSAAGFTGTQYQQIQLSASGGLMLFSKGINLSDANNLQVGTSSGTKIGTATTQKLGFYNATPVVQPTGDIITALQNLGLVATATISEADVTNLTSDLALKAPLASPTFTGTVVLPSGQALIAPALGTPASGVMTNVTGTASGLTAGNVTTNANLTGPITSSGNATSIASQTGTGTKFVVDTSPALAGTPTTPTAASGTNTTQIASTAFVETDIGGARLTPLDLGFKAWTNDPSRNSASNGSPAFGQPYGILIKLYAGQVINGVDFMVSNVGIGTTAGFIGLYDSSGTRQAVTADQTTDWNSGASTQRSVAFTGAYTVTTTGLFYLALLSVGAGTNPRFTGPSTGDTVWSNISQANTAAQYHFVQLGGLGSQTTLPSSVTLSSNTRVASQIFFGLH